MERGISKHPPLIEYKLIHEKAQVPKRNLEGDAGYDLAVCEDATVPANGFLNIGTGVTVACPSGYWLRLCGRSSTFYKRQLLVIEGVIDNGYRGELRIQVQNLRPYSHRLTCGDRIAQIIPMPVISFEWQSVIELKPSERGSNGFGSSGN